jgi:hypothetical protein
MDVGFTARVSTAPSQPASAPLPQRAPTATDLPAVQAVANTPDMQDTRLPDYDAAQRRARNIETALGQVKRSKLTIDDESRLVIESTVSEAGAIIEQYPNEWQVKQRIYARAELERELAAQAKADDAGEFAAKVSVSA